MSERPQVRDLEAPDRIQPSGLPSDTFAAPAAPPINNTFTQLVSALDHFNHGVKQLLNDPEQKQRVKQEHLAQYEALKATKTNNELVEAARAGQQPYWSDPYIKEIVHRDYAQLEAEALTKELDSDIANGKIAGFGQPTFDAEHHLLERSKPYLERVKGDPASMVAFGERLDTVRQGFLNAHQKVLGEVQTAAFDNVARDQIDRAITAAMDEGRNGGDITTGLRGLYKELGPRAKGGSLDLKYQHLDNLLVEILERKVKDPRYASQAIQMLHAPRSSVDDQKTSIGSLSNISARADKVLALENAAVKTLGDDAERKMKASVLAHDVEVLGKNDGTFSTIMDFDQSNPVDQFRRVAVGASKRKEDAIKQFIATTRQKNNGNTDFETEFETLRSSNVKHPEWFPLMESATVNLTKFSSTDSNGIQRFQSAAELYNRMADMDYSYVKEHTSKTAVDAFEMFTTLTRYANRSPEQAAHETAMVFSSEVNAKNPHITAQGRIEDIQREVRSMTFAYDWFGPFAKGITNKQEVENHVIELATTLSRVEGLEPDACVTAAAERIKASSVYINGRAVIGPGIKQGDEEHVQKILEQAFVHNKDRLHQLGIDDASNLSLHPFRNGLFLVVPSDGGGGPVKVPVFGPGPDKPLLRYDIVTISTGDIQKMRKETEAARAEKVRKEALERHQEMLNRNYQGQEFWWSEE